MTTSKHQRTIDRMRITMQYACLCVSAGNTEDEAITLTQHHEKWPECPTEGAGERATP